MSVPGATCAAVAGLAVTAALPAMVRAVGILEVVIPLRRGVLIVVGMIGVLDVADAGLLLPDVGLVWVGVDVRDDGGGGVSGRVGAVGRVAFPRVGKGFVGGVGVGRVGDLGTLGG